MRNHPVLAKPIRAGKFVGPTPSGPSRGEAMSKARTNRLLPCMVAVLAAACAKQDQTTAKATPPAVDRRVADESAIRANDSAWVKAIQAKNGDQAVSYYTEDAMLLAPGAPLAIGKAAVGQAMGGMMKLPGFALTFAPDKISVSGDMAYELGSYELTVPDKKGKPQTLKGKYVVVWVRQPDGSWKAVIDAPTTTM